MERAWVRVAREAVGADGQVVPQQWLAHTTAPHMDPSDRRRLDLVIYGATPLGEVLCCDATLVSPLTRTGLPQPGAAATDGDGRRRPAGSGAPQARRVPGTERGRALVEPTVGVGPAGRRQHGFGLLLACAPPQPASWARPGPGPAPR